ncbi:MAG: NUDIX domain-containing protein [Patescibacteria group bacterium]
MSKKESYPIPTVSALVVHKNKLLLVRARKWKMRYTLPGGHIKKGESIKKALIREVYEETGLRVHPLKLLIIHENIFSKAYVKKEHFISFEYLCQTSNTKIKLNQELTDYLWLDRKKINKAPVDKFTKLTIKKFLQIKS